MAAERGGFGSAVVGTASAFADRVMAGETARDIANYGLTSALSDMAVVIGGVGVAGAKVVGGVARGVGQSVGAMRRATFDEAVSALRHPPGVARAGVSAGPVNGQAALDVSVQVSVGSTRRIGIDYSRRQFVVLDEHAAGMFHGHVRNWGQLTQPMQATLRRAGMVDRRGNIIGGN